MLTIEGDIPIQPIVNSLSSWKPSCLTRIFAKSNHLLPFVKSCAVVEAKNPSSDFTDPSQRLNRCSF